MAGAAGRVKDPAPGRLIALPARNVWGDEARVFTPWLSQNLDLLAEALQLGELEHAGTEVILGDFRLDILATDSSGDPVVIENQFGRTDHGHLGQLISYVASQNRPTTTIWVAEQFKDSHRAAIDWLNASTSEEYSFFAVEIEALRIGNSDPAPFFNVVAKPNSWTRSVRVTANVETAEDKERHRVRLAYWASFSEYLRTHDASFAIRRDNRDHWFEFPIGRGGVVISATISTQKRRVGVELYFHNDRYKSGIRTLLDQRSAIEGSFGERLDWQELPNKKASRIALFRGEVDPSDPQQYPDLHAWMLAKMQRFRKVFADRVKNLDLGPADDVEDLLG